ncbi:MAG: type 4b pilus protein PilO2, partial [Luteimonas sp.]
MSAPMDATQSELQIVEINGRPFVCGLYWKPLRSVRSYMAEAKEIGRKEKWEMVTIRKGRTVIQAGFAPKGKRRLKGMYSLAAALAGQLGENWIGVFPIGPDRYALVAVYKGAVAPGFDLISSRDEVEPKLREVYSLLSNDPQADFVKSGRVIAPPEFSFGAESLLLADLLIPKALKNEYKLRPLTLGLTPKEFVVIAVGLILLAGAGLGAKWWFDEKRAEEERVAARAAAQAQL